MVRLCTFRENGTGRRGVGVLQDENGEKPLTDVSSVTGNELMEFIAGGEPAMAKLKQALAAGGLPTKVRENLEFEPPVRNPDKVLCIGMNYADHCHEQNVPIPKEPLVFNKFASSLAGPNADIEKDYTVTKLDFEVELVVVVGKKCRRVKPEEAMEYVFGYATGHDVSARCWQMERNGGQWLIGKAQPGYGPYGPAIVTRDECADIHDRKVKCWLNGEIVQDSTTEQMVHKTEALISWCSQTFELLPGDVIFTGTPPGVGVFRKPPIFLKAGDVVECEIQGLGRTRNKIVDPEEPAAKKSKQI